MVAEKAFYANVRSTRPVFLFTSHSVTVKDLPSMIWNAFWR